MSKLIKILISIIGFMILMIGVSVIFDLPSNSYDLAVKYSHKKNVWKNANDRIDLDNEWLELCKDGTRECTVYEQDAEYKENIPRTVLWGEFVSENPMVIFFVGLWGFEIYFILTIRGIAQPKIYTLNQRHELKYEGRCKYALYVPSRYGFFIKSPTIWHGWFLLFADVNLKNIITKTGILQVHRSEIVWSRKAISEIWIRSEQMEYDEGGVLHPGSKRWDSTIVDEEEYQITIKQMLTKTENMVRSGTRTNSEIRRALIMNKDMITGHDKAEEYKLDEGLYANEE